MQKTSKKKSASHAVKTVLGAVGPFKNKKARHQNIKTRHQETRQVDQTRLGVPKGTVADEHSDIGYNNYWLLGFAE